MKEGKHASGIFVISQIATYQNLAAVISCYSDLLPVVFMIKKRGPGAGCSIALREACRGYAPKEKKSICPRLPH